MFIGSYKTNSPALRPAGAQGARAGARRRRARYRGAMTLASFNAARADEAVSAMLACCASRRFAQTMAAGRPYVSLAAAQAAISATFESLTWDDVLEAMAEHPRIGARASGQSAAEQSGVGDASRAALAAGNAEYEQRFGHVFLICATGLRGAQMLAALQDRLTNNPATERSVATAELRKITELRATKVLGS
jgi:2-oxo-4-hydroxy-4-carboxy-5-ureidoimidazoline decarboxylase